VLIPAFPKEYFFVNEEIELDESMLIGEEYLCPECKELVIVKKSKGFLQLRLLLVVACFRR
jgi:hypothetical protein